MSIFILEFRIQEKRNILGGSQLSETELKRLKEDVPSLIPDENSGTCEPYSGTVCKQYIG